MGWNHQLASNSFESSSLARPLDSPLDSLRLADLLKQRPWFQHVKNSGFSKRFQKVWTCQLLFQSRWLLEVINPYKPHFFPENRIHQHSVMIVLYEAAILFCWQLRESDLQWFQVTCYLFGIQPFQCNVFACLLKQTRSNGKATYNQVILRLIMDFAPFLQWRNAMEHPKASYSVTEVIESINCFYRNIKQTEHTNLRIFVWEVNPWISLTSTFCSVAPWGLGQKLSVAHLRGEGSLNCLSDSATDGGKVDEKKICPPKKTVGRRFLLLWRWGTRICLAHTCSNSFILESEKKYLAVKDY